MWMLSLLIIVTAIVVESSKNEKPEVYYYGLEESERSLPPCGARQACSVLLLRYWRRAALLRLCRCERRHRCPAASNPSDRSLDLNNRAQFKFCQAVTEWPQCSFDEIALTAETSYERLDPDGFDKLHHKNIQLVPPNVTFHCRCREPNYWKSTTTTSEGGAKQNYQCRMLPYCNSGEFCGNVNYDFNSLYQSCMCPKHHICVHNGGVSHVQISELLYRGKGRKAYCQRTSDDYSYEDQ